MKDPSGYCAYDMYQLKGLSLKTFSEVEVDGRKMWVPSRPLGLASWRLRLKLTWDVFIGKADALYWPGQ